MDSHLGLWVHDLHSTFSLLEEDNAIYYAMTWTEGSNSYYSLMTVPCDGFYIEFLSEKATGIDDSKFNKVNEIRFDFGNFSHSETDFNAVKGISVFKLYFVTKS